MTLGTVRELWRFPVKSMGGERLDQVEVGMNGFVGDRCWAVRNVETGEIHNAKRFPILMQCSASYRRPPLAGQIAPVDVTLPDGTVVGSESPALSAQLSALLGRAVVLHPLEPAANRAFYRRRQPGAAMLGRVAHFAVGRRLVQWSLEHGAGGALRAEFGRTADEPLPDLREIASEGFEFYTPPGTFFDLFPIHILTTGALDAMKQANPGADWDVRRFRPNVLVATPSATGHIERDWRGRTIRIGGFEAWGELPTVRCAMPMHSQPNLGRDPSVLRTIVGHAEQCLGLYASVSVPGEVALGDPVDPAPLSGRYAMRRTT
jgi:uncharacterized protein YcbX